VIAMPEGDDPWEWWEVLDIFTGMDERLARMESLMEKQVNLLSGQGGGPTTSPESPLDATPVTSMPLINDGFKQRTSSKNVEIEPGKSKDVLNVTLPDGKSALWYEVGDKDRTYTEYEYQRDGISVLEEPQLEPLGLYNNPYRFPQPLLVRDNIAVVVSRDSDAGSSEDYLSKIRYVLVEDEMANDIKDKWEVA
jgi:hypothetical protein